MTCCAFSVTSARADLLFSHVFDKSSLIDSGATVNGGVFIGSSAGWKSNSVGDILDSADSIEIPLPAGLPEEGVLEFALSPDLVTGYGDHQSSYETVFELESGTGDSLFVVHIRWDGQHQGERKALLHFAGMDYSRELGSLPLGTEAYFGTSFDPGQTVIFEISYGRDATANIVTANGKPAVEYRHINKRFDKGDRAGNLGELFQRARILRIGIEKSIEDEVFYSPLAFTAINHLSARDRNFIHSLDHNAFSEAGYSGKLVAGDNLKVTMTAETGGTATFSLGSIKKHEMAEISPGIYEGNLVIALGDDVEDGVLSGDFTSASGISARPVSAARNVDIDTRVYMDVKTSNELIPADRVARSGLTIIAADANGEAVRDHPLKLTLSTTDEYTGTVGGGSFQDLFGGAVDLDWGGVTDSFGEVTAQYISGFAAKTILVSAKDMLTGSVGVGFVRSYIDGTVDIVVIEPKASALSVAGNMDVSLSRKWLTADGKSRSRITAVIEDATGKAESGHDIRFTLIGSNGKIRVVQGKTDSRGRAIADYIAGTVMGQVQVEVRDLTSGMVVVVPIELRPDAPAEIILAADPGEVTTGGRATVTAQVTDANGNPNRSVDVLYTIMTGDGELAFPRVATDEKGNAPVVFTAGSSPGLVSVKGTVISHEPTEEEISAAEGAVFLYGLEEDPGRLVVLEWLVNPGDEVIDGQGLVTLEDRAGSVYTVNATRDGIVSTFLAEERDKVQYGDTLGYVIEIPE